MSEFSFVIFMNILFSQMTHDDESNKFVVFFSFINIGLSLLKAS